MKSKFGRSGPQSIADNILLVEEFANGDMKGPDGAITRIGDTFPFLVIEVGYSQSRKALARTACKWLHGSDGGVQVVIVINITERQKPRQRAPWGLTNEEIKSYSFPELHRHVLEWHHTNQLPLLGTLHADMSICTWDTLSSDSQTLPEPIWEYQFSLQGDPQPSKLSRSPCSILSDDCRHLTICENVQVEIPFGRLEQQLRKCLELFEAKRGKQHAADARKDISALH